MDVQELLGKVAQHLSVGRAFGTAYEKDGSLVIPVALVAGGGGGGEGKSGSPTNDVTDDRGFEGADDATDADASSGSGGGFGGLVMPVGVYVVKDERARAIIRTVMKAATITKFAFTAGTQRTRSSLTT